jgi:hypothetical protein
MFRLKELPQFLLYLKLFILLLDAFILKFNWFKCLRRHYLVSYYFNYIENNCFIGFVVFIGYVKFG